MTRHAPRRPRGFTLIELLVVLVIIAILIALLVPAIASAVRTAKGAAVQAEINQLAQALADFKSKFGDYPPSRILLSENGWLNTTSSTQVPNGVSADITYGQLAQRSITALRKFWPRVSILPNGPVWPAGNSVWYDFNGNGSFEYDPLGQGFLLQGHECLVFFLGGIPANVGITIPVLAPFPVQGMSGFGKSPTNPFQNSVVTSNRTPPLFEFAGGRLWGNPNTGMPSYIDSINGLGNNTSYYAYFSTNLGTGYDPNDVNVVEHDSSGSSAPIALDYTTASLPLGTLSPAPNPYTISWPVVIANQSSDHYNPQVNFQNPQSFQIISPGIDGLYGVGGAYSTGLPSEDSTSTSSWKPPVTISNSADTGLRNTERDNLTNFHNGRLD
jgi:prepilin-type N-terminal cleavage/methylation domain-containing protein